MQSRKPPTTPERISRYTPGVTSRRLLPGAAVAAFLLATSVTPGTADARGGSSPPVDPELARKAAQAAHAVGDAADDYSDSNLEPPEAKPEDPLERARQGVVLLERRGKPLAVGTVLQGDGRILTALSPLGHGNNVDARFADGTVMRVQVGHSDRAWDLALLVPQNGRWTRGLRASRLSPQQAGTSLRTFSLFAKKQLAPTRTIVRGSRTLVGGDNELLRDGLELASRLKPTDVGSPVVDDNGDVVAIIARACAPEKGSECKLIPFGVPVPAVKAFLRTVPANAVPPAPWLGIQGVTEDTGAVRGVRVRSVHPRSPAAAAGMRGGADPDKSDIIVAVDGVPVGTPEELAASINHRAVGDTLQVLLFGEGRFRQVSLSLAAAPGTKAGASKQARSSRSGKAGASGAGTSSAKRAVPRRKPKQGRQTPVGY